MSIWSAMIDVAFNDPNMGVDATWSAGGTSPAVPCRVIPTSPEGQAVVSGSAFILPGTLIDVRTSEVPDPQRDDVVTLLNPDGSNGQQFQIIALGKIDRLRLRRQCEAEPLP